MSIDYSGLNSKISAQGVIISITSNHPLVKLGKSIPWDELSKTILPDLQATTKKKSWWLGRPLSLRIHLGAYLLQQIFNKTDRQTEYDLKDNGAYQLFCGKELVKKWHCPDHTKIEEFRSRLSPNTQRQLANKIAKIAVKLGFADPAQFDIDSTIQEANMAYPSDSNLLCKLGILAKKAADYLNEKIYCFKHKAMMVDLKKIKSYARRYFFLKKTASIEEKNSKLRALLNCVYDETKLIISNCRCMGEYFINEMPINIKRNFLQLIEKATKYLQDVKTFLDTGVMVADKILSFHLEKVCCFIKNKAGKKYQFGRTFQLARIKGNFLFVGECDIPNLPDKKSISLMLKAHTETFGKVKIKSVATDKGYYSKKNEKILHSHKVSEIGIQRPNNIKKASINRLSSSRTEELVNRRAGIEPLIGHTKHKGQLGRSRMKSDITNYASGYSAILGFNLRQMIRHKIGKFKEIERLKKIKEVA